MNARLKTAAAGCALLVLLVAAIYGQTAWHDFVNYDDTAYITGNASVLRGVTPEGIRWAFTSTNTGNWHPLAWISHMVDVSLFGTRAGAHHLVSAGIHAASACLLLLVLAWMTAAPGKAFVVAAVFAVHPLHVESVAWAAERKDILSTFLMLLALTAWTWRLARPAWHRTAAAVLLFALALMAKPMPVTFPFLLLLLDWWPLGRVRGGPPPAAGGGAGAGLSWTRLAVEKWPFLLLVAASSAVTVYAQHEAGAVSSLDRLTIPIRVGNALVSYVRYVAMAAWPADLAVFYPLRMDIPWWAVALAATLLAAATALVVAFRRLPWLPVGWFWYLGTLVPVIGLVQVGVQSHADRYTYFPLTGLTIAAVWGIAALLPDRRTRALLALAVLAALSVTAFLQVRHWRDGASLWRHAAAVTKGNWLAWINLGGALADQRRFPEAAAALEQGLAIKPGYPAGWVALGWLQGQMGDRRRAEIAFGAAIQNLGNDYYGCLHVGRMLSQAGEPIHAVVAFARALAANPRSSQARIGLSAAHNNAGNRLAGAGRYAEAVPHYREALRLDPEDANVRGNLERALRESGAK